MLVGLAAIVLADKLLSNAGDEGLGAYITTAIASHNVPEGQEKVEHGSTATVVTLAFAAMMAFQMLVLGD